jgi:hypothetical protein
MRYVDWTPEYLEGHVIVGLLLANSIDAFLFDENFVRQDWFSILGYGGYRIMVPQRAAPDARQIISDYRSGKLELCSEDAPGPACPGCASLETEPDPRPRRWVFLAYFFVGIIALFPALLRRLVYGRYHCTQCRRSWREPRACSFGEQQREAEAALYPDKP